MRNHIVGFLIVAVTAFTLTLWHGAHTARQGHHGPAAEPVVAPTIFATHQAPGESASTQAEIEIRPLAPQNLDSPPRGSLAPAYSQELLNTPAYRAARIKQISLSLRESYPWLASELELAPSEAEELFMVLAESKLEEDIEDHATITASSNQIIAPISQERFDRQNQLKEKREEAIHSLLGEPRYTNWRKYNENLVSFQQAFQLSRSLEANNIPPMSDRQRRIVIDAFVAELNRSREISSQAQSELFRGPSASELHLSQLAADIATQREERARRLIEVAERELDPPQAQALSALVRQQLVVQQERTRAQQAGANTVN